MIHLILTIFFSFVHIPWENTSLPIPHSPLLGLKVHSTFVTSTQGVPLGVIDQQVWAREKETIGIAKKRRQRETKDKVVILHLLGDETALHPSRVTAS